jgi:hypothetical protein
MSFAFGSGASSVSCKVLRAPAEPAPSARRVMAGSRGGAAFGGFGRPPAGPDFARPRQNLAGL